MSDGQGEDTVQVEDTTEKENIEPPTKKPKTEPKNIDLETRLNDILSCNVCLALPCKAIFQVSSNEKAVKTTTDINSVMFSPAFSCKIVVLNL